MCWKSQYDMKPPTTRSSHQPFARICWTHVRDVFQSSCTSWSSKIIAVGTVDSSQRTPGSPHGHAVQRGSTPRSRDSCSPGGTDGSRRPRMNRRVSRVDLVGVDLVAEQHEQVGPFVATACEPCRAPARRARRARARGRPRPWSALYGGSCGTDDAAGAERDAQPWSSESVRMTLGGYGEPGSGQTSLAVERHLVRAGLVGLEARRRGRGRSGARRPRTCATSSRRPRPCRARRSAPRSWRPSRRCSAGAARGRGSPRARASALFERGHGQPRVAELLPVQLGGLPVAGPDDGQPRAVDAVGERVALVDRDPGDEARERVRDVVERVVVVVADDDAPGAAQAAVRARWSAVARWSGSWPSGYRHLFARQ